MERRRLSWWIAFGLTVVWITGPYAAAQDVPFTGVIVEEQVEVRAGGGRAFYVVGELVRDDQVRVAEVIRGWYKIEPPASVHSYISQAYVDAKGDEKTGVVNTDRTEVRAASVEGPGYSYRGQGWLNTGDTVEIIAREGSYYKIAPPPGMYVFLPPGSVRRAELLETQPESEPAAQPSEPVAVAEPTSEPSASDDADPPLPPLPPLPELEPLEPVEPEPIAESTPDPQPEAVETETVEVIEPEPVADNTPVPTEPAAPPAPVSQPVSQPVVSAEDAEPVPQTIGSRYQFDFPEDPAPSDLHAVDDGQPLESLNKPSSIQTAARSPKLQALEARVLPYFDEPLEQQPIAKMIREYQAIQSDSTLTRSDQVIVAQRLTQLRRNQRLAELLITTDRATRRTEHTVTAVREQTPPNYNAIGQLVASSVYNGENLPLMYRLVDPTNGRSIGYVKPSDKIKPSLLGKLVGIDGDSSYDPALKLNILNVNYVKELSASGESPAAAQPQPEPEAAPPSAPDAEASSESAAIDGALDDEQASPEPAK